MMKNRPLRCILIANRAEIAVRIIRAAREIGVATVAVYSTADRNSAHVRLADRAVCIGPGPSKDSYLNAGRILLAAQAAGADAIHPGYGFLAENPEFAQAVEDAGLTFIGPSPACIALMGDKIEAKRAMLTAGLPCVPGTEEGLGDIETARVAAVEIGYPVILKASGGGGGRGMRVVRSEEELGPAIALTREEAGRAFGNDTVYMERYLSTPRHIEIQVICDRHGNCVWLGERDCSVQRRHQKVIEEAPAQSIAREDVAALGERCVRACREIGYHGAGTFEFLYENGHFAFIEMNTRIQVEHTVTEVLTGVDIVREQIRVARGEVLSFDQRSVGARGSAIELRINAEDPETGRPSAGSIGDWAVPGGPGVRIDTHIAAGADVPPYYDSMIAKLIVHGETRQHAIDKALSALGEFRISGVSSNIALHERILRDARFRRGPVDIHFLESRLSEHQRATKGTDP